MLGIQLIYIYKHFHHIMLVYTAMTKEECSFTFCNESVGMSSEKECEYSQPDDV